MHVLNYTEGKDENGVDVFVIKVDVDSNNHRDIIAAMDYSRTLAEPMQGWCTEHLGEVSDNGVWGALEKLIGHEFYFRNKADALQFKLVFG